MKRALEKGHIERERKTIEKQERALTRNFIAWGSKDTTITLLNSSNITECSTFT